MTKSIWGNRPMLWVTYALIGATFLLVPLLAKTASTIGNNASIGGTLTVTGASTFTGATTHSALGTFNAAASSTIVTSSQYLAVGITNDDSLAGFSNGDANIGNNLFVKGNTTVTGYAHVTGTLNVTGAVEFDASVSSTIVTTSRHLSVGIFADGDGTPSFGNGDLNVRNNINMGGTFTLDGNAVLGDATSDSISLSARIGSTLTPTFDNMMDLGDLSAGLFWRHVYASGTIQTSSTILAASGTFYQDKTTSSIFLFTDAVAANGPGGCSGHAGVCGLGGSVILEDVDGNGCTEIQTFEGAVTAAVVTCPNG